jgi:predicted ATPase
VLIILDNCEHVIDASARLAETLVRTCPKVWALATSREPLGVVGERIYRLPPLGVPAISDSTDSEDQLFVPNRLVENATCSSWLGDLETAAQLHGTTNALDEAHGTSLNPSDERSQAEDIERLRAAMGDDEFEYWYALGRAMSMSQAIDLALRVGAGDEQI